MNIKLVVTMLAVLSIAGCKTDFVGGVVINNKSTVHLLETVSGETIAVKPNSDNLANFEFSSNVEKGNHFNIQILDSQGQDCTIENNSGVYKGFPKFGTKIICADNDGTRWSGNPIIRTQYSADPTLVVEGDYLYMYGGKDEASTFHAEKGRCRKKSKCLKEKAQMYFSFDITGIHVYRTRNMVDWEYRGPALKAKDVSWMNQTWASHVVKKENAQGETKYYLYTCSPTWKSPLLGYTVASFENLLDNFLGGNILSSPIPTGPTSSVGVAVSDSPDGPFVDIGEPLIPFGYSSTIDSIMDPATFIDDDGVTYLFYGGGGEAQYVKLNDDMVSFDGVIREIEGINGSNPIPGFTEGAYVHKRNGIYYLSYSTSAFGSKPSGLHYAIANNVNGPWEYQGEFLDDVGIMTNHGAFVSYKERDYFFYHNGNIPGVKDETLGPVGKFSNATRAVAVEAVNYTEDGKINFIEQTTLGVPEI